MLESHYQNHIIGRLKKMFPGCLVLKNDSSYIQGIPDLSLYWGLMWAMLEVKTSASAKEQPNQRYYVEMLNEMSFAAFIYPEIEEEVLHELQQAFEPQGHPRISKR